MIKKVRKAVDNGDKDAAKAVYVTAQSRIDAIADKKIIHKNTAARHKGKLSSAIKAMGWAIQIHLNFEPAAGPAGFSF